ncbi:kinesin family protein-like protein [Tothia fuscella]|uniref:Kinesin family protein-like protein n=1 Tax=Tothia fuscella TaxID=1048955 RepID=A0A9P4P233_9PEZI|nr:kinesin family protein-like protein [Tothia fuscella]
MSNFQRPGLKPRAMAPPSATRRPFSRAQSATPINGRASPAESVASVATNGSRMRSPSAQSVGTKRKERDFDSEGGEETNINVVVRCRGRNDREIRENSGVVVSTDGFRGKSVDLSMGPSALSNKTYHFDKVFSPAADQVMVFDEVVTPIMDEVLAGFNCTIFAYGQTGTGKTYTMSGDISQTIPCPDGAGIIPRALHALFGRLDGEKAENSVKCSFIELYNEELRDLLSPDDKVKLKIYEETKKNHPTTLVQGMEESHITSAAKGIQLLRQGSHKRQVAATKCNDLSSRSHTVFTVTVYMKGTTDTGEDYVHTGKLNLVDLAGSENIQRSGAENKRATEAGLINKSLLTLGRVINALVDKALHIPYRESKLTRLLQDSLGGRTKTCIIATLSPAKSNLEETISTLDYAFRAKNIRNKPQVNQMVSKKTLLKEFTVEIEKLKSELIATRQRNGVYLPQETYEELTTESESRRILSEEQRDKIETMEINLRNKVQELISLTTNFNSLKKDNEMTKMMLDGTKSILEKTQAVLDHTKQDLNDQTVLREAHQKTEEHLANLGESLISTLGQTTSDIGGLQSKLRRRSNLQSLNRRHWHSTQSQVSDTSTLVDSRIANFQSQQQDLLADLSQRMQSFVQDELNNLKSSQDMLQQKSDAFEKSHAEVNEQTSMSRDNMNRVLEEIKSLREDVKEKVGAGLEDLSAAAQRISAGIMTEIDSFHAQLQSSYTALGQDFKGTFNDLVRELKEQKSGAVKLRQQIVEADNELTLKNTASAVRLSTLLEDEKQTQAAERQALLSQITALINSTTQKQEQRVHENIASIRTEFDEHAVFHGKAHETYVTDEQQWSKQSDELVAKVVRSRDNVKIKLQKDFAAANDHTESLRTVTTSVHDSTVKTVEEQMAHLDTQLHGLDDIVERIKEQNNTHHAAHVSSLANLATNVQSSYSNIGDHFTTSFSRVSELDTDMSARTSSIQATLPTLSQDGEIRQPLSDLREAVESQALEEYKATGETPQRLNYEYPTSLPRTEPHESLLSKLRGGAASPPIASSPAKLRSPMKLTRSPNKTLIFADNLTDNMSVSTSASTRPGTGSSTTSTFSGLRELDVNSVLPSGSAQMSDGGDKLGAMMPPLKRHHTTGNDSKLPKKRSTRMTVAGNTVVGSVQEKENGSVDLSRSVGGGGIGRSLRSVRNS